MRISLEPTNGLQPVTNTNHAMTEITGSTITGFDEILTEVMAGSLEETYSEDKLVQASDLSVDELTELYLRLGITSPAGKKMDTEVVTYTSPQTVLDGTMQYPGCTVKVPDQYVEYFKSAAQTYDISYELLTAVAKAESDFNTNSTSRSGAMGIMQLMPATAKYLEVSDAYEAKQNIMGGARYLKEKLNKHGTVELALAAYNAGSGAVEKYGGIPPYTETQNYVKKIKGFLGIA